MTKLNEVNNLESVRLQISDKLAEAQALFIPGMLLTFIARHPESKEMEMVITNDNDIRALSGVIERTIRRDTNDQAE